MRQVHFWGFRRIYNGPDKGYYYHKFFLKDRPDLCGQIRRKKNTKQDSDPNFYEMSVQQASVPTAARAGGIGGSSSAVEDSIVNSLASLTGVAAAAGGAGLTGQHAAPGLGGIDIPGLSIIQQIQQQQQHNVHHHQNVNLNNYSAALSCGALGNVNVNGLNPYGHLGAGNVNSLLASMQQQQQQAGASSNNGANTNGAILANNGTNDGRTPTDALSMNSSTSLNRNPINMPNNTRAHTLDNAHVNHLNLMQQAGLANNGNVMNHHHPNSHNEQLQAQAQILAAREQMLRIHLATQSTAGLNALLGNNMNVSNLLATAGGSVNPAANGAGLNVNSLFAGNANFNGDLYGGGGGGLVAGNNNSNCFSNQNHPDLLPNGPSSGNASNNGSVNANANSNPVSAAPPPPSSSASSAQGMQHSVSALEHVNHSSPPSYSQNNSSNNNNNNMANCLLEPSSNTSNNLDANNAHTVTANSNHMDSLLQARILAHQQQQQQQQQHQDGVGSTVTVHSLLNNLSPDLAGLSGPQNPTQQSLNSMGGGALSSTVNAAATTSSQEQNEQHQYQHEQQQQQQHTSYQTQTNQMLQARAAMLMQQHQQKQLARNIHPHTANLNPPLNRSNNGNANANPGMNSSVNATSLARNRDLVSRALAMHAGSANNTSGPSAGGGGPGANPNGNPMGSMDGGTATFQHQQHAIQDCNSSSSMGQPTQTQMNCNTSSNNSAAAAGAGDMHTNVNGGGNMNMGVNSAFLNNSYGMMGQQSQPQSQSQHHQYVGDDGSSSLAGGYPRHYGEEV